jgi:hypothetical protein
LSQTALIAAAVTAALIVVAADFPARLRLVAAPVQSLDCVPL